MSDSSRSIDQEQEVKEMQRLASPVGRAGETAQNDFELLAEAVPHLVWAGRPDGGLDYFNQRCLQYFQRTYEQMKEWQWKEVLHPDDVAGCVERWQESLATGAPYECEFRLGRASDGAWRWHLARALPRRDKDGRIVRWFGTCTDIHPQKEAESERDRLFELSADLFCIAGFDGYFRQINPAWQKTLGYSREELLSRPYLEFVHQEDREATKAEAQQVVRGKFALAFENRCCCRDGSFRWLSWRAIPVLESELIYAVARDVTDRKEAERALHESRRILEAAQQAGRIGSWVSESLPAARLIWSSETHHIFGVPEGEFDGRLETFFSLLHPEDRGRVQKASRAAWAGEQAYDVEHRIVLPHGAVRWVHEKAEVERDSEGQAWRAVGVVQDITERKLAQEALVRSEERYRSLVEGARDAIFTLSLEGNFTSLNPAFETISGWPAEEWLGKSFAPILHPEDRELASALFRETLEGKTPSSFELRVATADGGHAPVEFTVTPQRVNGHVVGVLGIGRDVRERHQLEEQLRQMQKLDSIGQLAAGIAHDFNNILTVQQGSASLLLMEPDLPQAMIELVQQILHGTERAAALTRQLLMFSRKQVMQRRRLELNQVVGNLTKMLGRILGEDVALQIHCDGHLPAVHGDPGMIEQVVMNLAINARDAMPSGGSLTVSTETVRLDPSAAWHNPEAKSGLFARLSVADTGLGIPRHVLEHIFEPFFTTKDVGKGTGLGLATVHGIVKQHEGWIEVESRENRGTTFAIYLPAIDERPAYEEEESGAGTVAGGTEAILVVEDETLVREMAKIVLERYGYRVSTAATGVEALRAWQEQSDSIDLLLTDLVMPEGMSGCQLADRLHRDKPGLKVIFSSGYSSELQGKDLTESGRARFLQKPYTPQKLAQAVRELLDEGAPG